MSKDSVLSLNEAFPGGARRFLDDALYADSTSRIAGAAIMTGIAATCALMTGAVPPAILCAVGLLITILRIYIAKKRVTQPRVWHDFVFTASSLAYLFGTGALTFWAYAVTDNDLILTLTLSIALVNTMSIALRTFKRQEAAGLHLLAVVAPVVAAFVWRGGYFYIAAFSQAALAWHVYTSALRLRNIFVSEFTYRLRSDTVAARFRFAIDNMSHGMCMLDRNLRMVISNSEFAETFGLPPDRSLQGARFGALVRAARRRGTMAAADADRLMACFEATRTPDSVARLDVCGAHGRVFDLTVKRNDEGGWVLVVQDVTDQRRAREALDAAARFDAMTGLPNRRSFEARLNEALADARRSGARTEVLFLDLDGFKQINDTLGHKFGDRVLAESARRLRESIGAAFASRWGGDEFVVLREDVEEAATLTFARTLIAELSRPIWIEGAEVVVGASVGAAACVAGGITMDTLLQQADMALYAAKRESRGECRLYELSMSEQARERRLLELDLQAALAARTFELHYQPIVDIETGELVSFEALARWRHPVRGAVSPALFVPVLEDLNLMNAFGAWALQRACEDAAKWPQPVRVGVNVSTRQIDTLLDSVKRALAISGLEPTRLELEITETAALAAGDTVLRTLEGVRALGVRIALDDFGTGYSSLSHLMQLPLDKVKIDKSFTQQLGRSRKADVLVANIARISSQLGMRVTFEGVETAEQLERARALGVPAEGQGWLFGKPTAVAELGRVFDVEARQAVA